METGRNRFFNICEAYQRMTGKSDSIGRDARRYRMVNEGVELDYYNDIFESEPFDTIKNERAKKRERLDSKKGKKQTKYQKFLDNNPELTCSNCGFTSRHKHLFGEINGNGLLCINCSNKLHKDDVSESYDVDAYENVYIGRTDDYYSEEEDDGVYSNPTWTWSEDANDKDFAKEGPVYRLTEDGKMDFFEWLDAEQVGYDLNYGRMKDYPKKHYSAEEEWDYLTNPGNGLSTEVNIAVGESSIDEDFGLYGSSNRPEIGFEKTFKNEFTEDVRNFVESLWMAMTNFKYNCDDATGIVVNKRVVTWTYHPSYMSPSKNKVKCRLSMVDGNPGAHWNISDDGKELKSDVMADEIREWVNGVYNLNDALASITFEGWDLGDEDQRVFDKMRIRQTGERDWNVNRSAPMFPAGTVIKAHLRGLGYLTIECVTDYYIRAPHTFSSAKKELREIEDEKREGRVHYKRNSWFTPPNLPESVQRMRRRRLSKCVSE